MKHDKYLNKGIMPTGSWYWKCGSWAHLMSSTWVFPTMATSWILKLAYWNAIYKIPCLSCMSLNVQKAEHPGVRMVSVLFEYAGERFRNLQKHCLQQVNGLGFHLQVLEKSLKHQSRATTHKNSYNFSILVMCRDFTNKKKERELFHYYSSEAFL